MTKKSKIKTKVSAYGRNLSLTMAADRFDAMAKQLPEDSEERNAIEQMIADARKRKVEDELKSHLNQPMSNGTLARFGWTLLSDKRDIVNAGVRHGDFRFDVTEDRSGWTFGPMEAFNREDEKTIVLHKAWQAGVFCEKHSAYMLGEPRQTEAEALQEARDMLKLWKKQMPLTLKPSGACYEEVHPDLPEGAMQYKSNLPSHTTMLAHTVRPGHDKPLHTSEDLRRIDILQFDARLGITHYNIFKDPEWVCAQRQYDPKWDAHRYIFDGPLDCVLGKVWGAVANTNPRTRYHGVSESHPHADRNTAEDAAQALAVEDGFIDG